MDIIFARTAFQSKDAGCVACWPVAFVLQLEKEMESRKQAMKWEKEFEEHQADGKVCLECRKCVFGTQTHEHKVYDLREALLETKEKFSETIKRQKNHLVKIEKSLAKFQTEKQVAEKKLQMCNTGIFALAEIDKKVTADAKSILVGLETFNKHFGDLEIAAPMEYDLIDIFEDACGERNLSVIRKLLKLLDNFPVSGKVFSEPDNSITCFFWQLFPTWSREDLLVRNIFHQETVKTRD